MTVFETLATMIEDGQVASVTIKGKWPQSTVLIIERNDGSLVEKPFYGEHQVYYFLKTEGWKGDSDE